MSSFWQLDFTWLTKETVGELQLIASVFCFGMGFVVLKEGMENGETGPFTFTAFWMICTLIVVLGIKLLLVWTKSETNNHNHVVSDRSPLIPTAAVSESKISKETKTFNDLVYWGCWYGLFLSLASNCQQIGLVTMSAGVTGFIVASFVVTVPIIEWIISGFGDTISIYAWIAAALSLIGLFLLSGCAETSCFSADGIPVGEYYLFLALLGWSCFTLINDRATNIVDPFSLLVVGFAFSSLLCVILALSFETSEWTSFSALTNNWYWVVLGAVFQGGGFVFTVLGQTNVHSTRAALLLSLQGVTAALFAYIFIQETLTYIELIGCFIMLIASMLAAICHHVHTAAVHITNSFSADVGDREDDHLLGGSDRTNSNSRVD